MQQMFGLAFSSYGANTVIGITLIVFGFYLWIGMIKDRAKMTTSNKNLIILFAITVMMCLFGYCGISVLLNSDSSRIWLLDSILAGSLFVIAVFLFKHQFMNKKIDTGIKITVYGAIIFIFLGSVKIALGPMVNGKIMSIIFLFFATAGLTLIGIGLNYPKPAAINSKPSFSSDEDHPEVFICLLDRLGRKYEEQVDMTNVRSY